MLNKLNLFTYTFIILACSISITLAAKTSINKPIYTIQHTNQVKKLLKKINPKLMWKELSVLTKFPDRSAKSKSGVDAAYWIKKQIEILAKKSGRRDISIFIVKTQGLSWRRIPFSSKQPSIVLKIGKSNQPAIIISAHLDTVTKCKYCSDKRNIKGANDDGSGTVGALEAARVILQSKLHFTKPIYFIWYAGEEQDCWGAQSVIAKFQKSHTKIAALMQLDQIGYARNNNLTMYLASDKNKKLGDHIHTNPELTLFSKKLIEKYIGRTAKLNCQGGSDEEVWADIAHVKTVRPLETDYCNPNHRYQYFHTTADTMDKLSLKHMVDYVKLAIAFAVELSHPVSRK